VAIHPIYCQPILDVHRRCEIDRCVVKGVRHENSRSGDR
jgi:hypothetical protein